MIKVKHMDSKTQDSTGEFTFPTPQIDRFYGVKPCICGKELYLQGSQGNFICIYCHSGCADVCEAPIHGGCPAAHRARSLREILSERKSCGR